MELLKQEYAHFLGDSELLGQKLDCLTAIQGKERIENWKAQARAGQWDALVAELLVYHYDPAYSKSMPKNYRRFEQADSLRPADLTPEGIRQAARMLLSTT